MNNENHLVPEIVKNIAQRATSTTRYVNDNEKFMAVSQLEAISKYCDGVLAHLNKKK